MEAKPPLWEAWPPFEAMFYVLLAYDLHGESLFVGVGERTWTSSLGRLAKLPGFELSAMLRSNSNIMFQFDCCLWFLLWVKLEVVSKEPMAS